MAKEKKSSRTSENMKEKNRSGGDDQRSNFKIIALVIVLFLVSIAFYQLFIVKPPEDIYDKINRSIILPRDGGRHDELMETWTFKGLFEDQNGNRFGYQVTYWNTGRRDVVMTDENSMTGNLYYYDRDTVTDKTDPSQNIYVSNKSLDLTYTNEDVYDRWVESETNPFNYTLNSAIDIPYNDFIVFELELRANKEPLLFGDDGKISLKNYGTLFMYLQSNVSISGNMFIDGEKYHVNGYGMIEHAWGSWQIASTEVWDIMLSNGKEISIVRLFEPTTGKIYLEFDYLINEGGTYDVTLYSDVYPLKTDYTYNDYQMENTSVEPNNYWIDPTDSSKIRSYIHNCTLRSNRNDYVLDIVPTIYFQRAYDGYVGTVDVSGTYGGEKVTGRGYIQLINTYKSNLDILTVGDNSDYIMNFEIPNDPVKVTATITDGIPLAEANLIYRVDGGENISLPMELLNETTNEWGATIPGQSLGVIVEYWVYAEDMASKWARSEVKNYEVKIGS